MVDRIGRTVNKKGRTSRYLPASLRDAKSTASCNTITEKQREALKALADWSKWLISLELALIVARIGLAKDYPISGVAVATFFCFTVSILAAAQLLGAVPAAMEAIPIRNKDKPTIYAYWQFRIVPFPILTFFEHVFFAVGLLLFIFSFACSQGWASFTFFVGLICS